MPEIQLNLVFKTLPHMESDCLSESTCFLYDYIIPIDNNLNWGLLNFFKVLISNLYSSKIYTL